MLLDHVTQSSSILKSLWKSYIYAFYIKGIKKKLVKIELDFIFYKPFQSILVQFIKKGKKNKTSKSFNLKHS